MNKNINILGLFPVLILMFVLTGCGENVNSTIQTEPSKTTVTQDKTPVDTTKILISDENGLRVFEATGQYNSPAGKETVNVTISTDKEGVIKILNMTSEAKNPASIKNQNLYFEGAKTLLVGKKLSEIGAGLDRVNGSSLTGNGFKLALKLIQDEAVAKSK